MKTKVRRHQRFVRKGNYEYDVSMFDPFKRGWKFTRKGADKSPIHIWDKKGTKIIVSEFYSDAHVNVADGWQVNISGVAEAKKGYPHNKVGISKSLAIKTARDYMARH